MEQTIKIPHQRVAVLIGKKGETKREIERRGKVKLGIKDNIVTVQGEEPFLFYKAVQVVKAIGRGFSPEKAVKLFNDTTMLDIVELRDYGSTDNDFIRLRGRVIGREGKSRRKIEEKTKCDIEVFGKTISIIGDEKDIGSAKSAVDMLLRGAQHGTVYKYLDRRLKKDEHG
ncbi:RNA-processing protein [Nanoarchaeota archaeon]|nr:MAG: RNA-processing protein [Nanoarchaeota archaeon]